MFERFTDRARRVVVLAQEEARLLKHNYIGTEHVLLGLIHEGEGVAAVTLERLGIELDVVRQQVRDIIGAGAEAQSGHIPFTPRAKKVLEFSLREALQLGHNYIGTEHILLGLIREGEGVASQILVRLGADLNVVRQEIIRVLHGYQPEGRASRRTTRLFDLQGTVESGVMTGFRSRLTQIEERLDAVGQRIGAGPAESELDRDIARVRTDRQAAAQAQDYEQAAVLRDRERELLSEQETRQQAWATANPSLPELAETVRLLSAEVDRLRALLPRQHITDQGTERGEGAA